MALTEGRYSVAPPGGECEVLRAPCCEADAGKRCQHELGIGRSSPQPAGPGNTSYAEHYRKMKKKNICEQSAMCTWLTVTEVKGD